MAFRILAKTWPGENTRRLSLRRPARYGVQNGVIPPSIIIGSLSFRWTWHFSTIIEFTSFQKGNWVTITHDFWPNFYDEYILKQSIFCSQKRLLFFFLFISQKQLKSSERAKIYRKGSVFRTYSVLRILCNHL